jgi:hypothetical protein
MAIHWESTQITCNHVRRLPHKCELPKASVISLVACREIQGAARVVTVVLLCVVGVVTVRVSLGASSKAIKYPGGSGTSVDIRSPRYFGSFRSILGFVTNRC